MINLKKQSVLLLLLVFSGMMWAQQRSLSDVADIASTHLAGTKWQGHKVSKTPLPKVASKGQMIASSQIMTSVQGLNQSNEAFYVYTDGEAFVIVSGDERMDPVLAYSNTTAFDTNNIPCNVKSYLSRYVKAFEQLGKVEDSTSKMCLKNAPKKAITGFVEPLVSTQWNQDAPFNNLCPSLGNGGKAATGCVATAMAQAMSVYKYPDCGTGTFDYTTSTRGIHLSGNLADYPLNWSEMIDNYNNGYTQAQGDAVATLSYACGVALNMDYGPESGAWSGNVMVSGIANFGYDEDMCFANLDAMPLDVWHSLVTDNLSHGYPVVYSGRNEYDEGHAFIIDGYEATDTDPFYHVNWGWGGWCDGNYKMLHLSPESTGIGGGMGNFNIGNCAVLGFKPDDGVQESAGFLQVEKINLYPEVIRPGDGGVINLQNIFNFAARNFSGSVIAYIKDADGNRYQVSKFNVSGLQLNYGWYSFDMDYVLPSTLTDGTYTVELYFQPDGFDEQPLYSGNAYPSLYVGEDIEPYNPDIMVTDLVTLFSGERSVNMSAVDLLNFAERSFTGKVKMAIAHTDGDIIMNFGNELDVSGLDYCYSFNNPQQFSGDIPAQIVDGDYRLYLVAQQAGYVNWAKVTKFTLNGNAITDVHLPCYVDVKLQGGKIYINEEDLPEFYADLQTTAFTINDSDTDARYVATSAEKICNFGNTPFTGEITLCVTDTDDDILTNFGSSLPITAPLEHFTYYNNPQYFSGYIPEDLADGAYKIQLAAKQNSCRGWAILKKWILEDGHISDYNLDNGIPFWVVDGQMTFTEPDPTEVPVTAITLSNDAADLYVGENIQLTAKVSPNNATNKSVTWTSSNTEVATVSDAGLVTAKALGNATITATAADGSGVTATCAITVSRVLATSITLNESEKKMNAGETLQLIATVLPEEATDKNVVWTSSDTSVATVSETGLVTYNTLGEATITATTVDGSNLSASCRVLPTTILVQSIELNYSEAEIHVGETLQLVATVLPENAENKGITWASGAKSIATVDDNGLVTAVKEGTTTIVATAQDVSGVKGRCSLTVLMVDGILNIIIDDAENIDIYSPDGKRIEQQRTGVNIIRNADGKVRKVFKK